MRIHLFHGLLPVEPRAALKDVFAGLTLSSMNIPQVRLHVDRAKHAREDEQIDPPWNPPHKLRKEPPCTAPIDSPRVIN